MRALYVSTIALILIIVGVLFAVKFVASGVSDESQVLGASTSPSNQTENLLISDINSIRRGAGVDELVYSLDLQELTDFRTQDLVERDYYSHKTPEGYTYAKYMKDYNISSTYSCENLQLQVGDSLANAVVAWQKSPAHLRCLVNPNVSKVAISYAPHGDVIYENNNQPKQMYVFVFIASN